MGVAFRLLWNLKLLLKLEGTVGHGKPKAEERNLLV